MAAAPFAGPSGRRCCGARAWLRESLGVRLEPPKQRLQREPFLELKGFVESTLRPFFWGAFEKHHFLKSISKELLRRREISHATRK